MLHLPIEDDRLRRRAIFEHVGHHAVKRPRIVVGESSRQQFWLVGLCDHDDVRLDLRKFGAGILPEVGGHLSGNIAAKAVEVKFFQPMLQHIGHVSVQLSISVVQTGDVRPFGVGWDDVALPVLPVELGMLHQHAVPGGVVRHDIDDDLQPALVRFSNEMLEIIIPAVPGIGSVVVLHGVRAADAAFLLRPSNGMDGYDPDNRDAKVFEVIEALFDAAGVARGGEGAGIRFIDNR